MVGGGRGNHWDNDNRMQGKEEGEGVMIRGYNSPLLSCAKFDNLNIVHFLINNEGANMCCLSV